MEYLAKIVDVLSRSREVKSLIGLSGRALWAIPAIILIGIGIIPLNAEIKLTAVGIAVIIDLWILHNSYKLGIAHPKEFHYGAEHMLASEKMQLELGDKEKTLTSTQAAELQAIPDSKMQPLQPQNKKKRKSQ